MSSSTTSCLTLRSSHTRSAKDRDMWNPATGPLVPSESEVSSSGFLGVRVGDNNVQAKISFVPAVATACRMPRPRMAHGGPQSS